MRTIQFILLFLVYFPCWGQRIDEQPSFTVTLLAGEIYVISSGEYTISISPGKQPECQAGIELSDLGADDCPIVESQMQQASLISFPNGFKVICLHNIDPFLSDLCFQKLKAEDGRANLVVADHAFLSSYTGRQIVISLIRPRTVIVTGIELSRADFFKKKYNELYPEVIIFSEVSKPQKYPSIRLPQIEYATKDRLKTHVEKLSKDFYPRNSDNLSNHKKTADYIKGQFELSGGKVSEQLYQVDNHIFRNVMVRFGPADKPRIVLGAHYDSYKNSPGADDNASGVASLIELAFLLGTSDSPVDFGFEFVAYATEEPPFYNHPDKMGSGIHAKKLAEDGIDVAFVLSLDQLGFFSDKPNSQRVPWPDLASELPASCKGDFILMIGSVEESEITNDLVNSMKSATNLPVYSLVMVKDSIREFVPSDALQYWNRGYKALLLTDTAPYRGNHRHSKGDQSKILSYASMRAVVRSLYYALMQCENTN